MNIIYKTGKILFQILASILILIAITIEYFAKPKRSQKHNNKIGKDNDKKIIHTKNITPA